MLKKILIACGVASLISTGVLNAQTTAAPTIAPVTVPKPAATQKKVAQPKKDGPCVAVALAVREDILIAANTARYNAVTASLKTRKAELIAAWNLTDIKARKAARTAAWKKFQVSSNQIRNDYRRMVEKAYPNFNAAVNACGVDYSEMPTEDTVTTKGTQ